MSITNMAVNVGGTSSVTGGTSTSYLAKGTTLDRRTLILDDNSDYVDQTKVEFSIKDPKVSAGAPNGYTQARSNVYVQVPLALDNGNRTINSLRIELSVDPETSDAEISAMLEEGAQILYQTALRDFWQKRALS